jgi:multidrug efflux pump subunit AcrA (membrane-fusion protein)
VHLQRRRRIGGILWGAGLVVAFGWGALDTSGAEGVGYGFAPPVNVAALETARVLEIPVHLHDAVSADQIVVRMDSEPLVEERQVAAAMLLAVQEEQVLSTVSEARKFAAGVEGTSFNRA